MGYVWNVVAMNGEKISVKSHRDGQPEYSVPAIFDNSNTYSDTKVSTGVYYYCIYCTAIQCTMIQ